MPSFNMMRLIKCMPEPEMSHSLSAMMDEHRCGRFGSNQWYWLKSLPCGLQENGAADSGNDFIVPFEGNQLGRSDLSLLGRVDVHGDWNGEELAFDGLFGHGFHFFYSISWISFIKQVRG